MNTDLIHEYMTAEEGSSFSGLFQPGLVYFRLLDPNISFCKHIEGLFQGIIVNISFNSGSVTDFTEPESDNKVYGVSDKLNPELINTLKYLKGVEVVILHSAFNSPISIKFIRQLAELSIDNEIPIVFSECVDIETYSAKTASYFSVIADVRQDTDLIVDVIKDRNNPIREYHCSLIP